MVKICYIIYLFGKIVKFTFDLEGYNLVGKSYSRTKTVVNLKRDINPFIKDAFYGVSDGI